jgi:hypothetical protein
VGQFLESNKSMPSGVPNSVHLETGELIDYFASRLSFEQERQIEEHIAGCGSCAESARGIYALVFDMQRLTARNLAEAFSRQAVVSALAAAADSQGGVRLGLICDRWLRGLGRTTSGVLKAVVRTSGAEFLFDRAHSPGGWKFSPEFALRGNDSGAPSAARKVLLEVPGAAMRSAASLFLKGNEVAVRVADWPPGSQPLAVLVDLDRTGISVLGLTTQVSESSYEIGFKGIVPGPYLLVFESIEKGQLAS